MRKGLSIGALRVNLGAMDDLIYWDATRLSTALAAKEISAYDLMQAVLSRIAHVNGDLNAIVSLRDAADLLAEAQAADASARKGWLHGIPIAIKDLANAQGLPTSMGSPLFAGQIAASDDVHVARLRAAGAIVIGKTNTPEFGLGSQTFNPVFGATRNPYASDRTCGGSSGGAAVALAAGMIPVADGSDMMGSLRNPAGWNNVYGMRPSWGRVPSEPKGDAYLHMLSTNGPMARSPEDLVALLRTMSGPDPRQPFGLPQLERTDLTPDVAGWRIGWLGDWGGAWPFEAGILDLSDAALRRFEDLGCIIEVVPPPFSRDALWDSWTGLRSFSVAAGLGPLAKSEGAQIKETGRWEIARGQAMTAMEVNQCSQIRTEWYARAAELFGQFDVLMAPTAQVWPFPVGQEYPTQIGGVAMDTYHRWMECVVPASLIGLPVVAVPMGFSGQNTLPMGLQLIGPAGGDLKVLDLAQAWHMATHWPAQKRPDL